MEKLIADFTLDRIQKKSAVFDEKKLEWVNKNHIKVQSNIELYLDIKHLHNDWVLDKDNNYLLNVIDLMKERVNNLNDFIRMTDYFFNDPIEYEEKAVRKRWKDTSVNELMGKFLLQLNSINNWNQNEIENSLRGLAESEDISAGKLIHPTRLAISGISSGPSLFDMMVLMGKDTCISRIEKAIKVLPIQN